MENNTLQKMITFMSIGGKRNWDWANIERVHHVKPGRELNRKFKKDIGQDHREIYLKTILIGLLLSNQKYGIEFSTPWF